MQSTQSLNLSWDAILVLEQEAAIRIAIDTDIDRYENTDLVRSVRFQQLVRIGSRLLPACCLEIISESYQLHDFMDISNAGFFDMKLQADHRRARPLRIMTRK